uniref:Secreted protein n=1 Tax=Magallana gigas TaxID=29159 RepID=A0A8W8KZ87_MAGGI
MNCFLATISFLHFVVINVILGFDDLSSGKPTIIEPPQNGLCGGSGCHIEYTVDGNQSTCAVTEEGTPDTCLVKDSIGRRSGKLFYWTLEMTGYL